MSRTHLSSAEIADRGQAIYDRKIRDTLAEDAHGKFLVLDVETGNYELDADEIAAVKRARAKNPEAPFYFLRVGYPAVYRIDSPPVSRH